MQVFAVDVQGISHKNMLRTGLGVVGGTLVVTSSHMQHPLSLYFGAVASSCKPVISHIQVHSKDTTI